MNIVFQFTCFPIKMTRKTASLNTVENFHLRECENQGHRTSLQCTKPAPWNASRTVLGSGVPGGLSTAEPAQSPSTLLPGPPRPRHGSGSSARLRIRYKAVTRFQGRVTLTGAQHETRVQNAKGLAQDPGARVPERVGVPSFLSTSHF